MWTASVIVGIVCFHVCVSYKKLRGAQQVQSERLDPRVMDSQLSVDAWALDTGQDAQIGRQPCWIWDIHIAE